MVQSTTALCPRCTSEVFPASARCRMCGLPRRDFASFERPEVQRPPVPAAEPADADFVLSALEPASPRPAEASPAVANASRLDDPTAGDAMKSATDPRKVAPVRVDASQPSDVDESAGTETLTMRRRPQSCVFSLGRELAEAVTAGDADAVCAKAELLSDLGGPWAAGLLSVAAEQVDTSRPGGPRAKSALISAAAATGTRPAGDDLPELIIALTTGRTPAVRSTAAAAIGRLGSPDGVPALRDAFHAGPPLSMAAIKALADIPGEASAAVLYEALGSENPAERSQAIRSLVKLGDPAAFRRVRLLTADDDERVARVATSAIASLQKAAAPKPAETDAAAGAAGSPVEEPTPDVTPSKAAEKKRRKPKKIRKTKVRRSRPSWMSFESLQSVSAGDLAAAALGSRTLVGGLALTVALAAGGWAFLGGSLSAMASGRNSDILMRGLVAGVSISGDGSRVAVGRTKNVLDVYEVGGGYILDQRSPASGGCLMTDDGSRAFSGSSGGGASWNLADKTSTPIDGFELAAMNPDRTLAVVGTTAGAFSRLDMTTGAVTPLFEVPSRPRLTAVATNADATQALVGCEDGSVRVWNEENGVSANVLAGPGNGVSAIAYSGDGGFVAVGGILGTVLLFEKGNPRPVLEHVCSNPKRVAALRFVGGDRLTAVAGDHVITVDAASGNEVADVRLMGAETQYVSLSDDAARVVAASEDSDFVRVYDTSTGTSLDAIKLD